LRETEIYRVGYARVAGTMFRAIADELR
jgi:hypothetical protein